MGFISTAKAITPVTAAAPEGCSASPDDFADALVTARRAIAVDSRTLRGSWTVDTAARHVTNSRACRAPYPVTCIADPYVPGVAGSAPKT